MRKHTSILSRVMIVSTLTACTATLTAESGIRIPETFQAARLFTISSQSRVQTVYAGEKVEFKFSVKFLQSKKEKVHLQVWSPSPSLKCWLSKNKIDSSKEIKLSVESTRGTPESKNRILVYAESAKQRLVYPFIVNILKKQVTKPTITVDFLTKQFNSQTGTDALVGRVLPRGERAFQLTFSDYKNTAFEKTVVTDNEGNFLVPMNDVVYGSYEMEANIGYASGSEIKVAKITKPVMVSPIQVIPNFALRTNHARKLLPGDSLVVVGLLQPSPGIVPIKIAITKSPVFGATRQLESVIVDPIDFGTTVISSPDGGLVVSQPSPTVNFPAGTTADTLRFTVHTAPDGSFRLALPITEQTQQGLYKIIAHFRSVYLTPLQPLQKLNAVKDRIGIGLKLRPTSKENVLLAANSSFVKPLIHRRKNNLNRSSIAYYEEIPVADPDGANGGGDIIECVVYALLGENARPGIVLSIVGGTLTQNRNYYIQTEIMDRLFLRLVNARDSYYRQFIKSDIIYFNKTSHDIDDDGLEDAASIVPYDKSSILDSAATRIAEIASSLVHQVPLYVVMLGRGASGLVGDSKFYLDKNATDGSMNVHDASAFLRELVGASEVDGTPRINRAFLLISSDYAGHFANVVAPLSVGPSFCNFAIVTSTYQSDVVYPGPYHRSFTWFFFNRALGFSPRLSSAMTEEEIIANFNLRNHYSGASVTLSGSSDYSRNGRQMSPRWSPSGCTSFFPIGYNNQCGPEVLIAEFD